MPNVRCPECEREVALDAEGKFPYHDVNQLQRVICYGSKLDPNWREKFDGRMRWFGNNWGAPMCEPELHIPTPVGDVCADCTEPIERGNQGVCMGTIRMDENQQPVPGVEPFHYECHLRSVIGGLNHQKGNCLCHGGAEEPDPPGMTRRESAIAAVKYWEEHRG